MAVVAPLWGTHCVTQAASGVARCAVNVPSDLVPLLEKIKTAQGMTRRHKHFASSEGNQLQIFLWILLYSSCWKNSLGKCSSNPLIQYLHHMFSSIFQHLSTFDESLTACWVHKACGECHPRPHALHGDHFWTRPQGSGIVQPAFASVWFWRSRLPD